MTAQKKLPMTNLKINILPFLDMKIEVFKIFYMIIYNTELTAFTLSWLIEYADKC